MKIFENTEIAFKSKTNSELKRAHFLFSMMQNHTLVKIGTSLTNLALTLRLPVQGLIRATVFNQFCGGITEEDSMKVIDKMYSSGVSSVLDYSVEGKEDEKSFDEALEKILEIVNFAEEKEAIPFAVFKPTAFGRFDLYAKVSLGEELTADEKEEWERVRARYDKVCGASKSKNLPILIDAEESWMQKSADDLAEEMMLKYNKDNTIVYSTLQMYRHDRMSYLKELHQRAIEKGFHIGMKVVRGAYMEKERERALEFNYESPICKDKQATDDNYNQAIDYMIKNKLSIFAGTHNEESAFLLMKAMEDLGIHHTDKKVWFGQLYGMSDHISFNLSDKQYNTAKYVPFGPVREVMPYLIRRAEENTSIEGQTTRELKLLKIEKKRRNL